MNKGLIIIFVLSLILAVITFNYFQPQNTIISNVTTKNNTIIEIPVVITPTVVETPKIITESLPVILVKVTTPKPTPQVKTTAIKNNTYVISTLWTDNGSTANILVELTFFTKQILNLTCLTWQNNSRPLLNTRNGTLYQFDGTSCQQNELAKLTYTLPNKLTKMTRMNLKTEISRFSLNLTGD